MKTRFRFLHSIIAVSSVLVMLFTSCNMFNTPKAESADEETVTLHIGDSIFRNALPRFDSTEYISFELTAERQGSTSSKTWTWEKTDRKTAEQVMKEAEITINTGTYNFTLIGKERYGATSRGEIKDKVISVDMSNADKLLTFTIGVSDVSEHGVGKAYITVNYNQDLTVKSLSADLFPTTDGIHYTVDNYRLEGRQSWDNLNNTSGSKEYIVDGVPAGKYIALFTFTFVDGEITRDWAWSEPVWISSERISSSTITINSNKYFTITYNPRGGTLTGNEKQFYTPLEDVTLTTPPVKEDLVFAGWYMSDDDGETLSDTETTAWQKLTHSGNIQLYAKWNAVVSFDANDSEEEPADGTMADMAVEEGSTISSLTANAFTRSGYTFSKWNTKADDSGTVYIDKASIVANKNTKLYAQWVEVPSDSVALTFVSNGGNFVEPMVVSSGATLSAAQKPVSQKTGYDFMGWFTSTDDGETLSSSAYTFENITSSVFLYAKWEPKTYTITYLDSEDIELSADLPKGAPTVHIYDEDTDLPVVQKDGSTFFGWFDNPDFRGNAITSLEAYDYTDNIVLYALWSSAIYVSASGSDSAFVDEDTLYGNGSENHPYKTISKALTYIKDTGDSDTDFTIVVSGTLTGYVDILSTNISKDNAKSLTIRGATGNETDILNANQTVYVMYIDTDIPITLRDIKITGGYHSTQNYSAGITVYGSDSKLTLESGALITGNEDKYYNGNAGGILVRAGTLVMEAGAEISNNKETGYQATASGGGVKLTQNATFIMNGGSISGNQGGAGGVYLENSTFTMNGGVINGNSASCGGGVYISSNNSNSSDAIFTMNDGKITGNTASYGGGVYIAKKFIMNGGEISDNTASTGGAVYKSESFSIGGSAYIPLGENGKNDVFFYNYYYPLVVTSTLTANEPIATIYYSSYSVGTVVIEAAEGVDIASEAPKFALKNSTYTINTEGKVAQR